MMNLAISNVEEVMAVGDWLTAVEYANELLLKPSESPAMLWAMKGVALHQLGRFEEAENAYLESLALKPDQPQLRLNRAHLCAQWPLRRQEAVATLRELIAAYPEWVDAYVLLSDMLFDLGEETEGIAVFEQIFQFAGRTDALQERYVSRLVQARQFIKAALYWRGHQQSNQPEVAYALGQIGLEKTSAEFLLNECKCDDHDRQLKGWWYQSVNLLMASRYSEAVVASEKAMELARQRGEVDAGLAFGYAWSLLATRRYQEAWPFFHRRQRVLWLDDPRIVEWTGQSLEGKTLLIHSEQGVGDVINCLRFLPAVKALATRVVFETYDGVLQMLQGLSGTSEDEGVSEIALSDIDFQIALMDVPAVLGVAVDSIPNAPYIHPEPAAVSTWAARLSELNGPPSRLRVGLVWAGNPAQKNDHNRSAALTDFDSLALVPGVEWWSLQKGQGEAELENGYSGLQPIPLASELNTLADTAAVIANLDLVITVCTSVAHLAGAMGKPVWVLVTNRHYDYRWHESGAGSEWYPSARLFRQKQAGQWAQLIRDELRPALLSWVQEQACSEDRAMAQAMTHLESAAWPVLPVVAPWFADAARFQIWVDEQIVTSEGQRRLASYLVERREVMPADLFRRAQVSLWFARREYKFVLSSDERLALPVRDRRLLFTLVQSALELNDFRRAEEYLSELGEKFGQTAEWAFQSARLNAKQEQWADAHQHFQTAVRIRTRWVEAINGCAFTAQKLGQVNLAYHYYQQALLVSPRFALAWRNLAHWVLEQGHPALAQICGEHALSIESDMSMHRLVGVASDRLGEYDKAMHHCEQSLALSPCDPQNLHNMAIVLRSLGRYDKALPYLEALAEVYPDKQDAQMSYAWELLARGVMRKGWQAYVKGLAKPKHVMPVWDGADLAGKSLLIYQDQGYGDLFQFVHLVREIKGNVTIAVNAGALTFMQQQELGHPVVQIDHVDMQSLSFDFAVEIMRLPHLLGVDLQLPRHSTPYYQVSDSAVTEWQTRLSGDRGLRVGFVWAGNPKYGSDKTRSTQLNDWLPVGTRQGVSMYSFQKDAASNQADGFTGFSIVNLAAQANDFADTAAMMKAMDLIISPDTGIAHLAAALGLPTWILIPDQGKDFRWMRNRTDVPWYPTARLFQQSRGEPWQAVLQRVATALEEFRADAH